MQDDLGHNPNASYAERMQTRATFTGLKGTPASPPPSEVTLTVDQLRLIARAAGFDLVAVADPSAPVHIEDKVDRVSELTLANQSLLKRVNDLQTMLDELRAPKDVGTQAEQDVQSEQEK